MNATISYGYIALMILVMGLITWGLRALPFVFKDWLISHPFVDYIKNRFPLIMMIILVVYASEAYKAEHFSDVQNSVIGIVVTAVLQIVFKNYLLSLFGGIVIYMALINHWIPGL